MKEFIVGFKFYCGDFSDNYEKKLMGESEIDVLYTLISSYNGIHGETEAQTVKKVRKYLNSELGYRWSLKKLLNSNIMIGPDDRYFGIRLDYICEA